MSSRLDDLPLLSRLLDEALDLSPEQLDSWLAALPPEYERLRAQLSALLALHQSPDQASFLATGPRLAAGANDGSSARPGDRVGPYRLIREIGRGGMGAVWLADGEHSALKRQVALKLPRIAWGERERLAERMARERDIGALLEHPSIARLYDAGIDDAGRPYLALEYVDGQPIDVWCTSRALSIPLRLSLFLQIARAVAYAHGRLVVHRDLKPSNVLVTADGRAHLLDFGIATFLRETAGDDERAALEAERALTPLYASPEQLRGEAITVASDVYSLGTLLFELVTGCLPHHPLGKSIAALEVAVLEGEAPLASNRASEDRTARELRGEIDSILAKALKLDPAERYSSADAMADDIERHLCGERVLAHPDSLGYRLHKTVRRHGTAFAAAGAVLMAVLGGTGVAVVEARRASEAAERARVVKEFVLDVFKVYGHGEPADSELRRLPVELLLQRGGMLIASEFNGQPALQAELYGVVGGMFAGVGAYEQAAGYARQQLATQGAVGAGKSDRAQATLLLAQALLAQGRLVESQSMARDALVLAESDPLLRPKIQLLLAHLLIQQGRRDEGMHALDEAEHGMAGQPGLVIESSRAKALRAGLLVFADRFDEAASIYDSALEDAVAAQGALSPTAIDIRLVAARNLALKGRIAEARRYLDGALSALRSSGGAGEVRAALAESNFYSTLFLARQIPFADAKAAFIDAKSTLDAQGALVPLQVKAKVDFDLGRAYLDWGDVQRAEPLILQSVRTLRPGAESVLDRFVYTDVLAVAAMYAGRHDEAETLFLDELEMQRLIGADRQPDRVFDYARRALNRSMQGRFEQAEAILAKAPRVDATGGADEPTIAAYREVARRVLARVKEDRGEALAAMALLPASDPRMTAPYPFDHLLLRGEVLCDLGRRGEGLALMERSLKMHQDTDYEHSPLMARAQGVAGLCALAAGQRDRAVELAALARTSLLEQPGAGSYFRRPSEHLDDLLKATAGAGVPRAQAVRAVRR